MKTLALPRRTIAGCTLILLLAGAVFLWQRQTRPHFDTLRYSTDGTSWQPFEEPLWLWNESDGARVRVVFSAPPAAPEWYAVHTSGELTSLSVNGRELEKKPDRATPFRLGPLLQQGTNTLEATMKSTHEGFTFETWALTASVKDFTSLWLLGLLCTVVCVGAYASIRCLGASKLTAGALTLGIVLRLLYALATPEWLRAYDWEGHHEYVLYMLKFWTIPPAALGWETYQPPLFYVIAAALKSVLGACGFVRYEALQVLPLWISAGVLGVGWAFSRRFWSEGDTKQFLFLLLLAVFPGLVFQASQISNDGLFTLIGALWILSLVTFQTTRRSRDWLLASLIVTIGLLTKSNALALVFAQAASLAVLKMTVKRKAVLLSVLMATVLLGSGWLFVLRFLIEGQTSIVGNVHLLPDVLRIPNTALTLFSFNPIEVIRIPFLNDIQDWTRREYFWEYLFKSSLFGSMMFGDIVELCRLLIVSALALLGLYVTGCIRSLKEERTRLFLVVAVSLIGAVFCYRWTYPMSSNQHFRFITPLVLPAAWFAVHWQPKKAWLAPVGESIILAFILLATLFLVSISFGPL